MKQRGNIFVNVDWVIVCLYLALCAIGVINIYAADFNPANSDFFDLANRSGKQILWIKASLVIAFIILLINGKYFKTLSAIIFGAVCIMQILVLIFAREVNGAKAWLDLGPFKLQPAEFSKFATALFLSAYMDQFTELKTTTTKSIENIGKGLGRFIKGKKVFSFSDINFQQQIIPIGIVLIPIVLILLQNDTGTALVFVAFLFVFYREGVIGNIFLIGISACVLAIITLMFNKHIAFSALGFLAVAVNTGYIKKTGIAIASIIIMLLFFISQGIFDWNPALNTYVLWGWISINAILLFTMPDIWKRIERSVILVILVVSMGYVGFVQKAYDLLQPHQRERIESILGKIEDKTVSFQTDQSLNAIGSGGIVGKGFLQGTHTKGKWVPEQSTDYIFCTVGEEWGFIGTSVVLCLFAALIFRIMSKAEKQRSKMSRVYGYSVATILFIHLLINIGMTVQIMPVIGIPLPFFSYGGSSLFGFTMLLFVFVKLDSQRLDIL